MKTLNDIITELERIDATATKGPLSVEKYKVTGAVLDPEGRNISDRPYIYDAEAWAFLRNHCCKLAEMLAEAESLLVHLAKAKAHPLTGNQYHDGHSDGKAIAGSLASACLKTLNQIASRP